MLIKEMARRTGLTTDTLRYYERIGLLPKVPRKQGGVRFYNESYVAYVGIIQKLKASGMKLEQIQHYMMLARQGAATEEVRKAMLMETKDRMVAKIRQMEVAVSVAEGQIKQYETRFGVCSADVAQTLWQC